MTSSTTTLSLAALCACLSVTTPSLAEDDGAAGQQGAAMDQGAEATAPAASAESSAATTTGAAPPVAAASSSHTLAWVSLGVGAVGVATGSLFALQAKGQRDELRGYCPSNECGPEAKGTLDTGKRNAGVATAAFLVGGAGLSLGALLLLLDTSDDSAKAAGVTVRPYVGLGSAGAIGRF